VKRRIIVVFLAFFLLVSLSLVQDTLAVGTIELNFGQVQQGQVSSKKVSYIKASPDNTVDLEGTITVDSSSRSWLSIEPKYWTLSPGETLSLTIKVDATNLAAGDYIGKAIDNNNTTEGQFKILVYVTVTEADPIISVEPTTLNFGTIQKTSKPKKTFSIQNTGGGTLSGKVASKVDWANVSISSYSLAQGKKQSVDVTLDVSSLTKGDYDGRIEIKSNDRTVYVNLTVTVESEDPRLSVSPSTLSLGRIKKGDEKEGTFSITNTGDGKLTGEISPEDQYIEADPSSFNLNPSSKVTITAKIKNTNRLFPGDYEKSLSLSSNGGNKTVNVTFSIYEESSKLKYEPTMIDFGILGQGEEKTEIFTIENSGGSTLEANFTKTADWIILSHSSTALKKDEKVSVDVRVNTAGLKEGVYKDKVIIKSNGGSGEIIILLQIKETEPVLSISEKLIKLPSKMRNERLESSTKIKNIGGKILTGSIECSNKAVTFNPKTFSLKSGDEITLNIAIDLSTLSLGSKFFSLDVSTNVGKESIFIEFELKPKPPLLVVLPMEIDAGTIDTGSTVSINLSLSNKGEEILVCNLSTLVDWIEIPEKQIQVKAGETYKAVLKATNKSADKEGEVTGKIKIESNGGNTEIPIKAIFRKNTGTVIRLYIGQRTAFKNDVPLLLDVPPQIYQGRTIVPLRFIAEAFGAEVKWEGESSTIRIYYPILNIYITLQVNNTTARIDKKVIKLDIPPMIVAGRTLCPLRFISEAFGAQVDWDSREQKITITIEVL
jgi:hypothetical protein